ncbi:glucagon-like peptide 1 receptor, partial [Antrostomus carolinensis]|uniref:glucagon-like peptide 1 receptor n=1 Tax=Antrostomus carolinensis TaxID=279965 RepID=UPI0005280423
MGRCTGFAPQRGHGCCRRIRPCLGGTCLSARPLTRELRHLAPNEGECRDFQGIFVSYWRQLVHCDAPEEQLLNLSIIYTIGYALSFSALVIATAILLGFRHLHCTRNYIHLNLFTSFILRAISVFIKDSVVKWMYSTATQEHQWEGLISFQESLSCRLVFVMMQYCVAANYYWLLVEGMYLYTLLVLSVFSEQRIFRLYLCIGW